jgi:hypothetical protein
MMDVSCLMDGEDGMIDLSLLELNPYLFMEVISPGF